MTYSDTSQIRFNLDAQVICRELADLGIQHDSEWMPADHLWALFFKDHKGNQHGCAFRIFGYFAPLLLVNPGTLDIEKGWISSKSIVAAIKNIYCITDSKKGANSHGI